MVNLEVLRTFGMNGNQRDAEELRLPPQSGKPLEDPSKGFEYNAFIKITNLYQGRYC
jgi:hypothetical protein